MATRTVEYFGLRSLYDGDKIVAIEETTICGRRVELGQRVKSNGRFWVPSGCDGTVVELRKPYCGGLTSDCIVVSWGGTRSTRQSMMKFKDLEL